MRVDLRRKTLIQKEQNKEDNHQTNNDWSEGDDEHWPMFACNRVEGGEERHNTLKGGRKKPELLLYGRKTHTKT
jgi:hypothetical protein